MDAFERLELPHLPWLDPTAIKEQFKKLSASHHPDRFHAAPEEDQRREQSIYMAMNEAARQLSDPSTRLRLLLEHHGHQKTGVVEQAPGHLMDWFMEFGQLARKIRQHQGEQEKAASPILKAQLMAATLELTEELNQFRGRLQEQLDQVFARLRELTPDWPVDSAPTPTQLDQLSDIHRTVAHLDRWHNQVKELLVNLSFQTP